MSTLTSSAYVTTDKPARYAKQLASHLSRKTAVVEDGDGGWSVTIGEASGRVVVGDGVLELHADAPDLEGLAVVEHVLGNHLVRFGQKAELTVDWRRRDE